MAATPIPGARESNAGDDFHVLWATRRVLGLLDLSSDLRAVVMEDLHPDGTAGVDPALLLGIDLTEFYGGLDLASCTRVIVSQLKYSHRNPTTSWTAARLGRKTNRRPSVIKRLADIYKGLSERDTLERADLLTALEIRLVTNQPIGSRLARSVRHAHQWLADHPAPVGTAKLLAAVTDNATADLRRLFTDSGLTSLQFTDFLRVLRLDGGKLSRADQELALTLSLSRHVTRSLEHHTRAIYDLVRRRALPENDRPIELEHVLAALNVGSLDSLFPAPSRFEKPRVTIPTPDPLRILDALRASTDRRVIAHGDAGVGKTTSVLGIQSHLPAGSTAVIYDCYAGGAYITAADARHTPERALLQVCNELAARCRLPLLAIAPDNPFDLWRELQGRIDQASQTLGDAGAELVIIFDALDNSAYEARRRSERSFIDDLWTLRVPNNVYLAVTARTGRLAQINPPEGITTVALEGFDQEGSTAHLRTRFPDATTDQGEVFHRASQGNPRVQFYALGTEQAESSGALTGVIAQADRTPAEIFDDLWEAAVTHAANPDAARRLLADLLSLESPKCLTDIAGCENIPVPSAEAFCRALAPGLTLHDGVAALRDEDFERYLEDKLTHDESRDAHQRLADYFAQRQDDPYAAGVLAEHLHGAGQHDELVRLATRGGQPPAITDPLARLQIYFRRIRLALSRPASSDGVNASKLLALAAEAAISDQAVASIIHDRPELALRYADPDAVAKVWRHDRNIEWQGPIHMRRAALLARQGREAQARSELRSADAWLERRRDEDRRRWELRHDDIAAYIEAVYWIAGWAAAIDTLFRWRPWRAVFAVGASLVSRLGRSPDRRKIIRELLASGLPAPLTARLLVAARPTPREVDRVAIEKLARQLARRRIRAANRSGAWPLAFVELTARVTHDSRLLLRLIRRLEPPLPSRAPHSHEGLGDFEGIVRVRALRAVCENRDLAIDELLPRSVTAPSDHERDDISEQERAMHEEVGPWLEVYVARARALLRAPRARGVARKLQAEIDRRANASQQPWYEPDYRFGRWLKLACETLLACRGTDLEIVGRAADAAANVSGRGDIHAWKSMAERLVHDRRYRDLAMVLVDRAADVVEGRTQPASELSDFLLDLCDIADRHDPQLAGDLYTRAVAAREGLDDEGVARLFMHAHLAPSLAGQPLAATFAERIARAVVDYRLRVSSEDYLPWRETLRAAALAHAPSGLAIASRWEDQRHLRISRSLPIVLEPCVDTGLLSARDALSLTSYLLGPATGGTTRRLLEQVTTNGGRSAAIAELEELSLLIRRDLSGAARTREAKGLTELAQDVGLGDLPGIAMLAPYIQYDPTADRATADEPYRRGESRSGVSDILEAAERCPPGQLAARLDELERLYASDEQTAEFLSRATTTVPPAMRVAVLANLTSLPSDHSQMRFRGEALLRALAELLEKWGNASAVRAWREQHLAPFLITQFPNVVRYRESSDSWLAVWTRLAGSTAAATELLIEAASEHLDQLPAAGLFSIAGQVASMLEPTDIEHVLDWSLTAIEEEQAAPEAAGDLSREEAISHLAWTLFANPDKRIRWEAAHAVRRVLVTDPGALPAQLLNRLAERDGGLFADPRQEFLWPSAQIWLLMTIARAGGDRPDLLAPIAHRLSAIALDEDWPHACVREFARRAALRAAEFDSTSRPEELRDALLFGNRPRTSFATRGHHWGADGPGERGPERWHFGMDIDRYWFGRLGDVFQQPQNDMLRHGERWIIDVLHTPTEIRRRRDDPRLEHVDYRDRDTHHGSQPTVEDFRVCIEYCALMLTAGELIDSSAPILVETYEPVTDPWGEWLTGHLDAHPAHWTADIRQPTPPDPALLCAHIDQGVWPELTPEHFAAMLGGLSSDALVIDSYVDYGAGEAYGHEWVSSALVEPTTARALHAALATAEDMSFFPLPEEQPEGGHRDHEIDNGPFRLLGWTREHQDHREGTEHHDQLARISLNITLPGTSFRVFHQAQLLSDERTLLDRNGVPVAWQHSFSDHPPGSDSRYPRDVTVGGRQSWVSVDALLSYLDFTRMDLIIKAHATRRDGDPYQRKRDREKDRVQDINRVCLLEHTGRLVGMEGHRSVR